jgi:mannosyltransferase OCH1-like enzyme
MIPNKIHLLWFSGEEFPDEVKRCYETWSKMKGYEINVWTLQDLSGIKLPNIFEKALQNQRWAILSDFVRLNILYEHGGIYLDSDVSILKEDWSLFHHFGYFSAVESHYPGFGLKGFIDEETGEVLEERFMPIRGSIALQSAIFGAEPGHPFLKMLMDAYREVDSLMEQKIWDYEVITPYFCADVAYRKYGFRYKNETQILEDGIVIFKNDVFPSYPAKPDENAFAYHGCHNTWRDSPYPSNSWKHWRGYNFEKELKDE